MIQLNWKNTKVVREVKSENFESQQRVKFKEIFIHDFVHGTTSNQQRFN